MAIETRKYPSFLDSVQIQIIDTIYNMYEKEIKKMSREESSPEEYYNLCIQTFNEIANVPLKNVPKGISCFIMAYIFHKCGVFELMEAEPESKSPSTSTSKELN